MAKYLISVEHIYFYYKNVNGTAIMTRIAPTVFPNKKKAKRAMRRLNKYHGEDWFLVRL